MRGDHFSPDVQALIALFEQHRVRYLLVGGEAVIYHGHPRLTGAVDFWFDQTRDNASRLFAALREYWEGAIPGVADAAELLAPEVIVQFGRPPNRIDLLSAIDDEATGLDFTASSGRATTAATTSRCPPTEAPRAVRARCRSSGRFTTSPSGARSARRHRAA